MSVYGVDNNLVTIDENFINGYLSAIALLLDYITPHQGFNLSFYRLTDGDNLTRVVTEEVKDGFNRIQEYNRVGFFTQSEILDYEEQLNQMAINGITFHELSNWETSVIEEVDGWIGSQLTSAFKKDRQTWDEKPNLLSHNLVELLKSFFGNKKMKVYTFEIVFSYWGGEGWLDLLFSSGNENYLLHFEKYS